VTPEQFEELKEILIKISNVNTQGNTSNYNMLVNIDRKLRDLNYILDKVKKHFKVY
jgi:hypothetical protein